MAEIDVSLTSEGDLLEFLVRVNDGSSASEHTVTASRGDLERLSRSGERPESFIERSFEFLLEREPKESILGRFDLSIISTYFPEFEDEISV
jgi:hypothetical protein